jgi:hypothetical protein
MQKLRSNRVGKCGLLALAWLMTACSNDLEWNKHTLGDQGRVEFTYYPGWFAVYSLDHGLLPGANVRIGVSGPGNEVGVAVVSTKPNVARFNMAARTCDCSGSTGDGAYLYTLDENENCKPNEQKACYNYIDAVAVAPGSTRLELRDKSLELVDSVTVTVSLAASGYLEARRSDGEDRPKPVEAITMHQNESLTLSAYFADGAGKEVLGDVAGFGVDDPQVARLDQFFVWSLTGASAGTTKVRVSVPGVQLEIPVTVNP